MGKKLEKEFKVKENEQHRLYMTNEKKIKLDNRDKRIQNFMKEKNTINNQKKMFSMEINKQKQLCDKMQNLLQKNPINENTLKEIKNMFPNNKKISNVLDEYSKLIKDEE